MDTLRDVIIFHKAFGHPVADGPKLIDPERLQTRIDWIISELEELKIAVAKGDLQEQADALADARYFLDGTIVECGMAAIFPIIFAEVQRANMSKACNNLNEAEMTIAKYTNEGIPCHYVPKCILNTEDYSSRLIYVIVRDSDGKTLKSINWSEPDHSYLSQYI